MITPTAPEQPITIQPPSPTPKPDLRSKIKAFWLKFYSNKKIFWPVSIVLGLLMLTIIAGLLFGGKGVLPVANVIPSPTPLTQEAPVPTPPGDILTQIERSLTDLKAQIGNLDVKQSRLQPPVLNFNIKF